MNDRDTGAEEAVTSQNFITRARLVVPAAHWAETTAVPAVGEVLRRDLLARLADSVELHDQPIQLLSNDGEQQ